MKAISDDRVPGRRPDEPHGMPPSKEEKGLAAGICLTWRHDEERLSMPLIRLVITSPLHTASGSGSSGMSVC